MTSNPIALRLHEMGLQMEGTGHDEIVAALGIAEREIERLQIKANASLANNLCADHFDKQVGKPCLACAIDALNRTIVEHDQLLSARGRELLEARQEIGHYENGRLVMANEIARLQRAPEGAVLFYGPEHYVLSNFSAFTVHMGGIAFQTSEHAYHWHKFPDFPGIQATILRAQSAHDAFKLAERERSSRRDDWDTAKVGIMRVILWAKVRQHEYVRRKLLETGDCKLIEDSWRDDFWGWGPNRDGQNMLGKLWMEIRAELRGAVS